jgi:hypothetical protein
MTFTVLFPLLIFRHARSLWLALDEWLDPHDQQRGMGGMG